MHRLKKQTLLKTKQKMKPDQTVDSHGETTPCFSLEGLIQLCSLDLWEIGFQQQQHAKCPSNSHQGNKKEVSVYLTINQCFHWAFLFCPPSPNGLFVLIVFRRTHSAVRMDFVLELHHPHGTTVITAKWSKEQMIGISIICQFRVTVNRAAESTQTKQAAVWVSQSNGSHVRNSEAADVLPGALICLRGADVKAQLPTILLQLLLESRWLTSTKAFVRRTELKPYPTTQVWGHGVFLI